MTHHELTARKIALLRVYELRYEISQRGIEIPEDGSKQRLIKLLTENLNMNYANEFSDLPYAIEESEIQISIRYLDDKIASGFVIGDSVHRFLAISAHVVNRIRRINPSLVEADLILLMAELTHARKTVIMFREGIERLDIEDLDTTTIPLTPFLSCNSTQKAYVNSEYDSIKEKCISVEETRETTKVEANTDDSKILICYKCNGFGHRYHQCSSRASRCAFCKARNCTAKCKCEGVREMLQQANAEPNPGEAVRLAIRKQMNQAIAEARANSCKDNESH